MGKFIFTATLLVLCVAGTYAQTAEPLTKQFPAIDRKELDLKYLGSDSSSVLERIKKTGVANKYLQKHENVSAGQEKTEKLKSTMPIMQPNSSIQYQILAVIPDSSIRYHIQVKKPD